MKYEIKKFSSESFMKGDSTTLEFYLKNIYKLSIESINNNEIDSIVNLFKDLSNDFERIGSYLEIDNEENHQRFLYGMFYAIVTLIIELSEIKEENNNALILFNKYKLLYPILNTISVLHKASGQELKKALKFKNESNLTNFVSRINKYNLIYIQKLGNTNYYSLTPKGKKTLSLYCVLLQKSENSQLYINEDILIEFLDEISNQLNEEEPSLLSVINVFSRNKIQLKNKHILKLKINTLFASREEYMKKKVKFSLEQNLEKMNIDKEYNNYFMDELCCSYEPDNEEIIDYHNW